QPVSDGPAPSNYSGSSASLQGNSGSSYQGPPKKQQQQQQQSQKPPRAQQSGPPGGGSPFGGLDLAALAPMAMGLFGGGGNKGPGGGSGGGAGGLGALAALAPMAMGLLGGGGNKSGGGGAGGLGPLMGIATSFLGGGGASGGKPSKSSAGGGDFFSGILGKVFGSGTRDLDNGSMDGLGRRDAERYHNEIYSQQRDPAHYSDEQLGAAAAVEAIGQMQNSGTLDMSQGHEDASQKILGAVMGEAVKLHKRHESQGGMADKESTAVASVHTALKIIEDAADVKEGRYASPPPSGLHRDNSFGSQQHSNSSYDAPYNAPSGGYQNEYQGGYQNQYQGGHQGGYQGGHQNEYQGGYQGGHQGGGGFPGSGFPGSGGGYNAY
ncbi:hypothetical protein GGF45_003453, partial [Coemansia sp. RSA 551]